MDNFNLKKFLTENKLTQSSYLREGFQGPADPNTVAYNKIKSDWDAGAISDKRYSNTKWMDLPDEVQKDLYDKYKDDYYEDTMDVDTSGETWDYEMNEVVVATEMTTQETSGHAERFAKYMSDKEGKTFTVTAGSVDGPSFDLDLDGEKYEGGSFLISQAGEIINMALPENPVYGNISMLEGKKEYYKNAEADDAEHIKALEKDMKDDKKSSKMKMSELKAKIKEMALAEIKMKEDTFAPTSQTDFLAELEGMLNEADEFNMNKSARIAEFITALNRLVDDYHAELYLNDDLFAAIEMVIKAAKEEAMNLDEAKKDTEEVDNEETTDDITVDDTETIDTTTTTEVDPDVKEVQDALTQAQAAAQKLGDPKLTDQIGNTITFFTRSHVVEKGAVAEYVNEDLNMSNTPEIENIISLLQGVDGETMEYILRQVGIEDQMKKQLSGEDDEDEYNDMYHPKGFDI